MKTCINLLTLTLVLTAGSGCSKFRQLTRRDYTLLRDPFASRANVADSSDAEPPPLASAATSGFADVSGTDSETAGRSAKADYGAESGSEPGTSSGPKGFAGVRVGGGDVISPNTGPSLSDFVSQDKALVQTRDPGKNAAKPSRSDTDFAAWASAQAQEWKKDVTSLESHATPLINPVRQVSDSIERSVPEVAASPFGVAGNNLASPSEKATPLIRPQTHGIAAPATVGTQMNTAPPIGRANPFATVSQQKTMTELAAPVFDAPQSGQPTAETSGAKPEQQSNPFADFDVQPGQNGGKKDGEAKTLDAGFNFDTGWKPSEAENP